MTEHPKRGRSWLIWIPALLLVALILGASWVPESQMVRQSWIPGWLGNWADRSPNLRTLVPFVPLAFLFYRGSLGCQVGHPVIWSVAASLICLTLAELGQFWLPGRTPDLADFGWGSLGIVLGLFFGWVLGHLFQKSAPAQSMMKIVLINQYFPPDGAPTGLMLSRVANDLVAQGHDVTVLCARGGYAGSGAKGEIRRDEAELSYRVVRVGATGFGRGTFVGKLIDYAGFYLGVAWQLMVLRPRPDRMVALTTPPFLSLLVRVVSKLRGADHAHWVMDLYPDVMVSHGMISEKGIPARILGILARWGFGGRRCAMVLTLGPDMDERVSRYLRQETPREWVPLWGTAKANEDPNNGHEEEAEGEGGLLLMYSGNMGLGHRFQEFLEAAAASGKAGQDCRWKFHGQGKRRGEIEEFVAAHPAAPVSVGDYVPLAELAHHLASADVHLASLEPSWDGTMVPSKLQGIFAIGKPVIFVGSEESSIGRWILESGGGWVVPPGEPERMQEVLSEAREASIRREKGQNALRFSRQYFDAKKNSQKIAKLLAHSQ